MADDCPAEGPDYKIFFLNEEGKIKDRKALKGAASDEDAIAAAKDMKDGRRYWIYDGCRLVVDVPAD